MDGMDAPDAIVVGAGANGLVCALALARTGLNVIVFEERPLVGGVHRTEFPFAKAPRLAAATGAHRLGFFPQELARQLRVDLALVPRDPSLFVPTTEAGRFLLAGAGNDGLRAAISSFSPPDAAAITAIHGELDAMLSDLGSAWLAGALPVEETADRFVRPELRETFVALCRGSLAEYLARFGLQSGLLKAVLATEAVVGSWASFDTPGSGAPLLIRHAARALGGGGDGISLLPGNHAGIIRALVESCHQQRVKLATGVAVREIVVQGTAVSGVVLADGRTVDCSTVIASADPVRLSALAGAGNLTGAFAAKVAAFARPGAAAKVNLALSALPRFTALPEDKGQHRATTFLLPGGDDGVRHLARSFSEASAGAFPSAPPLEVVFSSEESLHHASILVPWAPYDLAGTTWAAEEERALGAVLDVLESFAPGSRSLVVDAQFLHPKKLETHFGVTRGHLRHTDDTFVFGDRMPYVTPVTGLYSCSSACAPAGGMLGIAGHNAATRVLADFELGLERTEVGPTR
jgi:phytoene dehydrogenase-like protein